ncbi:MAG: methyltransferase domain-containing protein [Vicinamibacteria bacterium]
MSVVLRCPVRGCQEALRQDGPRWSCARQHSFDQHRSGYLNLLQPQDSRSREPGDSRETARSRRRLADAGQADAVHQAFLHVILGRSPKAGLALLDVGCGEGAFLRALRDLPLERHGLDISAPSIELAVKASPSCLFVVANADRTLPYADASFDLITSIDARTNADEFHRVLKPAGLALIASPGPRDLIELRSYVQGAQIEKSRKEHVEEEMRKHFSLLEHTTLMDQHEFEPAVLRDLLVATYRGFRQSERSAVAALTAMTVTLSHEIFAFQRR